MIGHSFHSIISGSSTGNSPKISSALYIYTVSGYITPNILHDVNRTSKPSVGIFVNVDASIATSNTIMETLKIVNLDVVFL